MLALEIEYLSGLVYAADFRSRDRPEWPPHPARLFSALVAASYQSDLEGAGLEVLRWLEEQKPPSIACGHASKRTVPIIFVPVNDNTGEAVLSQFRTRRPRTFPCAVPDDPKIYFIWPDAQPTERQRAWLGRIAENVTYLGSSRSLVRVVLCNAPPPPNLAPAESGEHALRVVGPGRVDELAILFDLGRRPTPGILQPYAPLSSQQSESHYPTDPAALRDFFAFRCISGPPLSLEAALTLTCAVRAAMLSHGGDDAPDLLHGHARRPHCTFLPLPFVGHTHADGHLLGFALTLPKEISKADRSAVLSALAKLKQIHLPGGCTWRVASAADDPRRTLWRSNWMGPSCYWSTVTPLVLDRFPRPGKAGRRVEDIIARSCQDAGYPVPVEIATHFTSPLRGVPPSWAFRVRRSESDPCRPYTHVTLRFERPMHGPLVLGAGRYFGLGLFQPLKSMVFVDDDDGSE